MVKICEGFRIKDACEAHRHMDYTGVADYGREAYGHSLHTWDDGFALEFEFPRRFPIETNGRLRWSKAWEDDL